MSQSTFPRLLLVEDETKVATFIKKGLETQRYTVETADDGREGKRMIAERDYDLIILDLNLPYVSGLELCAFIRVKHPKVPILMLTALGSVADKLAGFDAGADDYLVKPFDFMELMARVKALLKRTAQAGPTVLQIADLELDLNEKIARRQGQTIDLTAREFALLEYLMRNAGRVVSRNDIAEHVWDINFDTGTNVIDVYISYVRNKVDKDFPTKLIHTVVGMGYILKQK